MYVLEKKRKGRKMITEKQRVRENIFREYEDKRRKIVTGRIGMM